MKQSQRIVKNAVFGIGASLIGGLVYLATVLTIARMVSVVEFGKYSFVLAFALFFQLASEGKSAFVDRDRQTSVRTLTKHSSAFVKCVNGFAKLDRLVDVQQVVRMFVKTGDSFSCQTTAKCEYEVVVGKLAFNLAVSDGYDSIERIDVRDFRFNEVNFSIQQRLPQVERNIVTPAFTKSESHECGIENKLPAPRDERNLMLVAKLLGESLCGNDATEPATQYQNLHHR